MLEENAATVTKLVFVRLITTKDRKIIVSLFVGEEEDQAQELAVDAARGRHARRQESHVPVVVICVTIVADLVGSCVLEHAIRVVGVAEAGLDSALLDQRRCNCGAGCRPPANWFAAPADVADFEIGAAFALTREHPLVTGGETIVVTNVIQCPQDMVVSAGPTRRMMEAGVDVVPGTLTTHEVQLAAA